jgi:hypothetical protein
MPLQSSHARPQLSAAAICRCTAIIGLLHLACGDNTVPRNSSSYLICTKTVILATVARVRNQQNTQTTPLIPEPVQTPIQYVNPSDD